MALNKLLKSFLTVVLIYSCYVEAGRIYFKKCGTSGFTCKPSKQVLKKEDITFQCHTNSTGQDITIHTREFSAPENITSLTIQNCEKVRIYFGCPLTSSGVVDSLKIANVKNLEIIPSLGAVPHMPLRVTIEDILYMDTIPRHAFSHISNDHDKQMHNVKDELSEIFFRNVTIGTIETEAFWNLTKMRNFSWIDVSVYKVNINAIELSFVDNVAAQLHGCYLNILEPLAFRIIGDAFYVTHSKFGNIWGNGFNGTMSTFVFTNNSVSHIQSGAIAILAKHVYIVDNQFNTVESGAFQKIEPGLLRDSEMNFAKLRFVYTFTSNHLQTVLNGGIEPDMPSYKNVASDVTYANNIMQVFLRTPSHEHQQRSNIVWN